MVVVWFQNFIELHYNVLDFNHKCHT